MMTFKCLFYHDLYEYFVPRYYAYEGTPFVTFVRNSLYPEGI
jgi:hypothetical protein